ncbi:MAG: hypothetical protein HPY50_04875 [Firmicutes bacterium]|nr:hypothetical protein [Bacillota bacterium]
MAAGDFTPVKLLQKALDTTSANSAIAGASNKRRYITSISLLNTNSTTRRTVSVYGYGTTAVYELFRVPLEPSGSELLTELPYFVNSGESFYFKQDTGADVNILVMGTEEALT